MNTKKLIKSLKRLVGKLDNGLDISELEDGEIKYIFNGVITSLESAADTMGQIIAEGQGECPCVKRAGDWKRENGFEEQT